MRKKTAILAAFVAFAISGCGGSEPAAETEQAAPAPASTPAPAPEATKVKSRTDFDQAAAATLYRDNCAACHQPNGEGITGIYPAFRDNAVVKGPVDGLLKVILEGRGGMPSFLEDMSPEEIALVTNHLRNDWGGQSDLVTADQVKAIAAGLNKASGDARKDD